MKDGDNCKESSRLSDQLVTGRLGLDSELSNSVVMKRLVRDESCDMNGRFKSREFFALFIKGMMVRSE